MALCLGDWVFGLEFGVLSVGPSTFGSTLGGFTGFLWGVWRGVRWFLNVWLLDGGITGFLWTIVGLRWPLSTWLLSGGFVGVR